MNTMSAQSHIPGFADPVGDAQRVFRAVLDALARPTVPRSVETGVRPPAPLGTTAGAVILALCDEQTPVWIDPVLRANAEVGAWIAFHTGARVIDDAGDALFLVASSPSAAPRLSELLQGTDEEPHHSATLIIDARGAHGIGALVASGPGVDGVADWDGVGLPDAFLPQWQENRALFPRGVDIVMADENTVRGLPRTTALIGTDKHIDERRSA